MNCFFQEIVGKKTILENYFLLLLLPSLLSYILNIFMHSQYICYFLQLRLKILTLNYNSFKISDYIQVQKSGPFKIVKRLEYKWWMQCRLARMFIKDRWVCKTTSDKWIRQPKCLIMWNSLKKKRKSFGKCVFVC